ncbi:MAG TPA: hypothetical protein DDX75_15795 [Phycisphaerales bacterium]|nr:hypothetical protein [Phycisphaerales bacterium]
MNKLFFKSLIIIICFSAGSLAVITVPKITNVHPRMYCTQTDINDIQAKIAAQQEPWYEAWIDLKNLADSYLGYSPNPYSGQNSLNFYENAKRDGGYCRDLALAYQITGNNLYADKAQDFILAWAQAIPIPASNFDPNIWYPNSGMEVGRSTMPFQWAYDLIYNYSGFASSEKAEVANWFRVLERVIKEGINRWEKNDYFGRQYYQNHLAAHCLGLVDIAYALGDEQLSQYAVDSNENPRDMIELISGCILMPDDTPFGNPTFPQAGEIIDRYRHVQHKGMVYCHLTMTLLTLTAEILYNNGIDCYSYYASGGENLSLPFDFYVDFFKLRDSCVKGGYYCGESVYFDMAGICELGLYHYPQSTTLVELLQTIPRAKIREQYLGSPVLIYGVEIESYDGVIANWKMNDVSQTYSETSLMRNAILDSDNDKDRNHHLILGRYNDSGRDGTNGEYEPSLTINGSGASGMPSDYALEFNGINQSAYSPYTWPDVNNVYIECDVKPVLMSGAQTIIYTTNSFELRLVPSGDGQKAKIDFHVWYPNGFATASSSEILYPNHWSHIRAKAIPGFSIIEVDGQSGIAGHPLMVGTSYNGHINVGTTHAFNTRFFGGHLDNLIITTGSGCGLYGYLRADLNKDCYVNFIDLLKIGRENKYVWIRYC